MNQRFLENGARVVMPLIAVATATWGVILVQLLPWKEISEVIIQFWVNN
ncbi:MAG: hypothetical protein KBD27_02195 [Candidatus Moranbacteria bacterium]|nr:hypothetical protein [Candidatus Moranbacteria bacterium]